MNEFTFPDHMQYFTDRSPLCGNGFIRLKNYIGNINIPVQQEQILKIVIPLVRGELP